MKKSISIRIPEPCHEDWQKMTQTEKGKICGVCIKEVIDFTSKTDEDLVKILVASKDTCGRFKKTQLNRELKMERKSGLHFAPYAASLLLPLSLISVSKVTSNNNGLPEKSYSTLNIGRFSKPNRAIINTTGIITDASGKTLENVIIRSNESNILVKSDANGNYSITTMDRETLSFESVGFLYYKIVLGSNSSEKNISLIPEITEKEIGEIAVMGDTIEVFEEGVSEVVSISGTVRDGDGLILPGVNIVIEGTKNGTQSDLEGNYSLEVEMNQTMQFSLIGYTTKLVSVSNISNSINVNLEFSVEIMGGVIVMGGESFNEIEQSLPTPISAKNNKKGEEFKGIQQAGDQAARKLKRSKRK